MSEHPDRLRQIFEAEFDFVWRTVRRLGVRPAELDDAVQQVFVVLSRRLERVEQGREKSFLYGTARRVAADHRRRYRASREDLVEAPLAVGGEVDPASLVDQKRARQMLQQVLDEMPTDMRDVFCLYELEGLTTVEVANTLGIAVGTAASRLRRSRALFERATHRLSVQCAFEGGGR